MTCMSIIVIIVIKHHFFHYPQVNELQAQIKERTRKMMAMVSELTMHQAEAMKLAQQKKDMEGDLEQCYIKLEKGEAPSTEIEREWLRMVRDEHRRMTDKELARMVRHPLISFLIGQ